MSDADESRAIALLGVEPQGEFHDLAELAAAVCSTPIALVSLMDESRLYPKGTVGMSLQRIERAGTFCDHALRQDDMLIVPDASADARFAQLASVKQAPGVRFYAGLSLLSPSGTKIGSLCVLDTIKRELRPWQISALRKLGHHANMLIELHIRRKLLEHFHGALGSVLCGVELFTTFTDAVPFGCYLKDSEHRLLFYNRHLSEQFGLTSTEWLGKTSHDLWPRVLADQVRAAEENVFRSRERGELLIQLPSPDGQLVPTTLYQSVYRDPLGVSMLAVMMLRGHDRFSLDLLDILKPLPG